VADHAMLKTVIPHISATCNLIARKFGTVRILQFRTLH